MSTRCQIGIYSSEKDRMENPEILIYRHNDGYPEGILDTIVSYCQEFHAELGMGDSQYLAARLVWKMCETRPGYLSVGVGGPDDKACDIEFYYRIDCDTRKVWCFPGSWGSDGKAGFGAPLHETQITAGD